MKESKSKEFDGWGVGRTSESQPGLVPHCNTRDAQHTAGSFGADTRVAATRFSSSP